ncbi:hypothetical protein FCG88_005620 [Klebsiella pneumoniae]|uniref:hypothetical protein n=1 Tax=Klebsiella pneumoniae complex TaxID=3390273 RepID=UPI0003BED30B|nr:MULTISPECIES: hypothetical protein [Klebsiella]HCB1082692.1 hypothetical protein [Klebsiella variicola subsp. variicola]ESN58774.1 hypothetical protein L363_02147 [Klebsiella pneumoniae MGH 17]TYY37117.1 hypothetical protein FCG88_005620 [Klebsiella pneumoniae]SAS59497.1 Uncharacterised protein [Klebsiella variicola]VGH91159.1 Uncharacterised protein [Klebsiella pneumoniae]
MDKERKCSFGDDVKEPIIERVFSLVERYPSRNEAAKAWGININTLQNYYKRRDLAPVPRMKLLEVIANHEGVSLEWLVDGIGEPPVNTKKEHKKERKHSELNDPDARLATLFSILSDEEKQSLFEIVVRKGVETVLRLRDDRNIKLLQCNDVDKERLLVWLESGMKKEAFEASEVVAETGLANSDKKAG